MVRFLRWVTAAALVGLVVVVACEESSTDPPDGGGATGAGGCPSGPVALFTVRVTASDGQVPADTSLLVRWSAGEEPVVDLLQPDSWQTVEDGANVECDIPEGAAPPLELDELRCELWTSGATYVEVAADGYLTLEETLTPKQVDECESPVPSDVDLELVPDADAGA